jgi:hypothetical protein
MPHRVEQGMDENWISMTAAGGGEAGMRARKLYPERCDVLVVRSPRLGACNIHNLKDVRAVDPELVAVQGGTDHGYDMFARDL